MRQQRPDDVDGASRATWVRAQKNARGLLSPPCRGSARPAPDPVSPRRSEAPAAGGHADAQQPIQTVPSVEGHAGIPAIS
jgi:hypothetical protein